MHGAPTTPRGVRLWELYRLTEEDWDRLWEYQEGRCGGCQKPFPKRSSANTDHRHHNGMVSGLLCMGCNKALGYLRDCQETLRRLAVYLEDPPAPRALEREVYGLLGKAKRKKKMVYGGV